MLFSHMDPYAAIAVAIAMVPIITIVVIGGWLS